MKLGFTTLGCPDWDLDTIICRAVEYGYDGVDFRGYRGEMNVYKLPEFSSDLKETAKRFSDAGLEVPCFSSSARVAAAPKEAIDEVRAYLPLCVAFGARYIRVFPGKSESSASREQAAGAAARTLNEMGRMAADHGVAVVIETHDAWVASDKLKLIMDRVDSPGVGVLWDTHHPYRLCGESPSTTWRNIGKWVRYVHVKDSFMKSDAEGYQLCLQGDGDIPVAEILRVMKDGGYEGYLTLEWEKKWHPEIEEPQVAFPRYVKVMRELLSPDC